jgi:hypothetical protein
MARNRQPRFTPLCVSFLLYNEKLKIGCNKTNKCIRHVMYSFVITSKVEIGQQKIKKETFEHRVFLFFFFEVIYSKKRGG